MPTLTFERFGFIASEFKRWIWVMRSLMDAFCSICRCGLQSDPTPSLARSADVNFDGSCFRSDPIDGIKNKFVRMSADVGGSTWLGFGLVQLWLNRLRKLHVLRR